jgi:bla regulator protein BlaR1
MRVMKSAVIALAMTASAAAGFAGGRECKAGKARVFADDRIIFANGIGEVDMDALTARYGKTFLYMERGAKAYLVTDAETLDRVRHILLPQSKLGQQQAVLGTKQAALGSRQAALGLKQGQLGMQQIGATEARQRELERKQNQLSRQQEELGRQQEALGHQQETLGRQQEALQMESDKQVDAILDQAITRGIAKVVR